MSNKQKQTQKKSIKSRSANGASTRNAKISNNNNNSNSNGRRTISKAQAAPIARASLATKRAPIIRMIKNGTIISNTELIGPVYKPASQGGYADSTDLFTAFRLRCNPGSKATFAWLAGQAVHWEYYRFRKLRFYYETRSPSTKEGSLILSPDYDSADGQVAVSEQGLFSNKGSVDDAVWKHISLNLDPAAMNRLFKSHAVMGDSRYATTSQDVKTIDVAQVFCCVDSGDANAYKFGKLFVEYEVELTEPQMVTEPPNQGGFSFGNSVLTPTSTTPIASSLNLASWKIDPSIFTPTTSLPEVTYPTAIIGRFAKDYQGIINAVVNGTGITSVSQWFLNPSAASMAALAPGDVGLGASGVPGMTSATQTQSVASWIISAKAGDYLKLRTPTATSLSSLSADVASILVANIL